MSYLKITKTQEKYLKELLIKQLSGEAITIGGFSWDKDRVKAGTTEYDGRATNSIKKMLYGDISLGITKSTDSIHFDEIVFSIKDVLTKLENGRKIMDDVMTGLALYADYENAYTEQCKNFSSLEKEAKQKSPREYYQFCWDIDNVKTEVGAAHSPYRIKSSAKLNQYKNFVSQF